MKLAGSQGKNKISEELDRFPDMLAFEHSEIEPEPVSWRVWNWASVHLSLIAEKSSFEHMLLPVEWLV